MVPEVNEDNTRDFDEFTAHSISRKNFNTTRYRTMGRGGNGGVTHFMINGGRYLFNYGFSDNPKLMEYYTTVYLGLEHFLQNNQLSFVKYFVIGSRNSLESLKALCKKLPKFNKILDEFGFKLHRKSRTDMKRVLRDCSMFASRFESLEYFLSMGLLVTRRTEIMGIDSLSKEMVKEVGAEIVSTLRKRWISDIQILALLDVKYIEASIMKMIDKHYFRDREENVTKITVRIFYFFQFLFFSCFLDLYF